MQFCDDTRRSGKYDLTEWERAVLVSSFPDHMHVNRDQYGSGECAWTEAETAWLERTRAALYRKAV